MNKTCEINSPNKCRLKIYRPLVLATSAANKIALHARGADVVEDWQILAFVKVAVLNDLVDGETFAQLRDSQQFGVGNQLLLWDTANMIPSVAFTTGATLLNEFN